MLRVSRYVVPATLLLVSVPFLCLFFYAVPAGDDFCKAALAFNGEKQRTLYDFVRLYYWGWSPRWLTTFLQGVLMHHGSLLASYPYLLLTLIISHFLALGYFFSVILKLNFRTAVAVAALFYMAWLLTLESPAENIYWLTGASEYILPLSFMLLVASFLWSETRWWKNVLACGLCFLIPAQHELAGASLSVFLLVGAVFACKSGRPALRWVACFAAAVVSLGLVVSSPALHIRAVQEARHLWDFRHAPGYALRAASIGAEWILNPATVLAACYAVLFLGSGDEDVGAAPTSPRWWAWLCLLGMVFVLLELFASEIVAGFALPDRAIGWLHFMFCLFLFLLVLTARKALEVLNQSAGIRIGLIALLVLALVGSKNFRLAVHDMVGPARAWRQSNSARLDMRAEFVQWEQLPTRPSLFMNSEVSADPTWWTNRCTADYLGVQSVAVTPPRERAANRQPP